jgi:hypothetical protein
MYGGRTENERNMYARGRVFKLKGKKAEHNALVG